jgi:hypothetical protein
VTAVATVPAMAPLAPLAPLVVVAVWKALADVGHASSLYFAEARTSFWPPK